MKAIVVISTVRRPCGHCYPCSHGENDMCSSGAYTERGTMRRHGFLAEFYVESLQWLNKIRKPLEAVGVLLEPMSVVEKGIEHSYLLQRVRPAAGRHQDNPRDRVVNERRAGLSVR
jgi:glucose 1-dehydrogenase